MQLNIHKRQRILKYILNKKYIFTVNKSYTVNTKYWFIKNAMSDGEERRFLVSLLGSQ